MLVSQFSMIRKSRNSDQLCTYMYACVCPQAHVDGGVDKPHCSCSKRSFGLLPCQVLLHSGDLHSVYCQYYMYIQYMLDSCTLLGGL